MTHEILMGRLLVSGNRSFLGCSIKYGSGKCRRNLDTKQIQFDKDCMKKYNKNIYVYNLQRIGGKRHASNF